MIGRLALPAEPVERKVDEREAASHIVLADDWGPYRAGQVIAADVDRRGQLELEGVRFRDANPREIALAGF